MSTITSSEAGTTSAEAAVHPLDPLTAEEIGAAVALLRRERSLAEDVLFVRVVLHEPPKEVVLGFRPGDPIDRQAFVILRDRGARATVEAVVSITKEAVVAWQVVPNVQPSITFEEFFACEALVRSSPAWQAAVRRRGVEDPELAIVDPWSAGYYGLSDDPKRRLIRALTWVRTHPEDNGYARPVEGVVALVDMDAMEVVEIEDHGVTPLPPRAGNYSPEALRDPANVPRFPAGPRTDLRPLEITQREGPSFEVRGREVRWQKWRFRVGFTPREGLVLHTVGYEDQGRLRPILYRASLSEMVVPYGDPAATHWRKNAFDEGEYGIGMLTNALELGCDCLGEIRYFDAVVSDATGTPSTLPNAICLHEEDFGILWKHTNFRTGHVEVRRSRRLVVSSIATVGNYEYGFFWYFYQDGTIELQLKLTGIVSTGAVAPGVQPAHGTLIAPGLYAPHHQHWFNFRLDMTVDGPNNSVYEVNSEAAPLGSDNAHGNAWVTRRTLLARESEAQREIDPLAGRYWLVVNPGSRNALGEPTGYKLVPGDNVRAFAHPDSSIARRAGFITRHLWVTRYDAGERYAAGDYPNQHPGGAGLPAYVRADRALDNTDVVVWYSLASHHVVRPEDWPVQPVAYAGFALKPVGFFDGSPALDVPAPARHAAGHCHP
jgi:primary-amine oxidase